MVIIQPFVYEKITAFKERVQIISKVNEIIDKINNGEIGIQEDRVIELIENELLNYYTKAEVDDAISSIDLSVFYTKLETDNLLSLKRDITDSYSKSETDNLLGLKRDITDSYSKSEIDTKEDNITDRIDYLEENKQNILTPIFPIVLESDSISLKGFTAINNADWSPYFLNRYAKDDCYIIIGNSYLSYLYLPKGTCLNNTMCFWVSKSSWYEFNFNTLTSDKVSSSLIQIDITVANDIITIKHGAVQGATLHKTNGDVTLMVRV